MRVVTVLARSYSPSKLSSFPFAEVSFFAFFSADSIVIGATYIGLVGTTLDSLESHEKQEKNPDIILLLPTHYLPQLNNSLLL